MGWERSGGHPGTEHNLGAEAPITHGLLDVTLRVADLENTTMKALATFRSTQYAPERKERRDHSLSPATPGLTLTAAHCAGGRVQRGASLHGHPDTRQRAERMCHLGGTDVVWEPLGHWEIVHFLTLAVISRVMDGPWVPLTKCVCENSTPRRIREWGVFGR